MRQDGCDRPVANQPRAAVFRVDASTEIGGGHVMRCLTLADALVRHGWRCAFACRPGSAETVPALERSGHAIGILESTENDESAELAARWPDGVDLLVVDHYRRDVRFERACRPWARRIMAIDDLADRRHDADLLLDQTLGRSAESYAGLVPSSCRLLLGSAYVLLRPQFAAARTTALARRHAQAGRLERILVALGLSDPHDVTSVALRGIAETGLDVAVDVVLGPAAPHLGAVRRLAASLPQPATLHVGVDDMASLMVDADLAIGAAGSSSWERCCLGLPTLVVVVAENQRDAAHHLAALGAVAHLDLHGPPSGFAIADQLLDLHAHPMKLCRMSKCAVSGCGGRGTEQAICDIIRHCF
jgi:UDP-2,4-diacetamido-2,4,6-trideoxy-beta-L-altropyranose hydrolase